jgi:hypothetical protein
VDVEVGPFGKGVSIEEYKEKEGEPVWTKTNPLMSATKLW